MGQYGLDKHCLRLIIEPCDHSDIIAANIKYKIYFVVFLKTIGRIKGFPHVRKTIPPCLFDNMVPSSESGL